MDPEGNFVVTWYCYPYYYEVYARRYDSSGNPASPEFQVNTYTYNQQYYPDVAIDGSGNFIVTWYGHGS